MPTRALRIPATIFCGFVLCLALNSCSSSPRVCNIAVSGNNSSTLCPCGGPGATACPFIPGPEFLYAHSGAGQILAFSIDHYSGALTTIGSVPGPAMSYGLAAVNNQFLFASDRSQSQLDGFSINPITGALSVLQGSPFPTGAFTVPAGLASPPNSSFLYAADIAAVDAFTVSSAGVPSAISGSPFPSGSSMFLTADPSGSFLFSVEDDSPGGVIAFAIGSTGALTEVPNSPFTIPGQTVPDSMPYGIVNNGSYVYTTLSLASQVAGFAIAGGTGALTPVPNSPFPAGTNPTAIAIANNFLYALNTGSISGYSINSNSGLLTPLAGSPFAISGLSLAADSFGEYLFVGGPAGIQAFTIDAASGMLTPISGSPFVAAGASLLTVVQIPPP